MDEVLEFTLIFSDENKREFLADVGYIQANCELTQTMSYFLTELKKHIEKSQEST